MIDVRDRKLMALAIFVYVTELRLHRSIYFMVSASYTVSRNPMEINYSTKREISLLMNNLLLLNAIKSSLIRK